MIIKPQTLKGFRDFLPDDMNIRNQVINVFKKGFEKYGYEPLETPALEYADILLGKYGKEAEKLIYQFTDHGGRQVAMKYDLTVPTCRVIAQYANKISLPFKRYQIQPVWRADNTQRGRFREFYQCDADTIGTSSMVADAEFIQMGLEIINDLGFKNYIARINNRKLVNGLIKYIKASENQFYNICILIDKLEKIGEQEVKKELHKSGLPQESIEKIFSILLLNGENSDDILKILNNKLGLIEEAKAALVELREILNILKISGVNEKLYTIDLSIIRGLSYYTGPVWEFSIKDENIGSIAGCGRYDELIGMYLGRNIPATGGSFGIERIIEVIKNNNLFKVGEGIKVLVTIFDQSLLPVTLRVTNELRNNDISTMLFPEVTKLDKQLKYADRKGIPYVIIIGPEEAAKNVVKLKNMKSGKQKEYNLKDLRGLIADLRI